MTGTATALETVPVRGSGPDWEAIERLIDTWRPDALVLGLPLDVDGDEQRVTGNARRFGRRLEGRYGLRVHLCDERFSTREARSRLAERGRALAPDHPVAAQVILESWLSSQRRTPDPAPGAR